MSFLEQFNDIKVDPERIKQLQEEKDKNSVQYHIECIEAKLKTAKASGMRRLYYDITGDSRLIGRYEPEIDETNVLFIYRDMVITHFNHPPSITCKFVESYIYDHHHWSYPYFEFSWPINSP